MSETIWGNTNTGSGEPQEIPAIFINPPPLVIEAEITRPAQPWMTSYRKKPMQDALNRMAGDTLSGFSTSDIITE
ncbi:MAG: hypothetical protein ACE5EE_11085 [Fidelibacterota bacterium]